MQCPTCSSSTLRPLRLEAGLAAAGCGHCEGYLVSVLGFRAWAEDHAPVSDRARSVKLTSLPQDSSLALKCAKCARLMTKYRIDDEVANKLDLCAHCGEIWLDGGEWALLGALDLQSQLPAIFTEPWQRAVRREAVDRSVDARLAAKVGPLDFDRVREFALWLDTHPHALELRAYLNRPR